MSTSTPPDMVRAASLDDLNAKGGIMVVHPADRPIALFLHEDKVNAVDNRCPHLGFPLHKGSVQDGILTCHWHHARFDLCSGCTFDLWADDVPAYDTQVRDGDIYVAVKPRHAGDADYYFRRLEQGMQQNISLIQAKCLVALLRAGVDYRRIVKQIALFGLSNRDGWGPGLVVLTAMANLVPHLSEETAYLVLYQGARRVADDCAGQPPRRKRYPLDDGDVPDGTLKRWLRYWTLVRHRDGAERTLLTAALGAKWRSLLHTAATDRFYANTGHLIDFQNKAMELIELIGEQHAADVLPSLTQQLVTARGGEEMNEWRHPMDLVPHLKKLDEEIPLLLNAGRGRSFTGDKALAHAMLGDDPLANLEAIKQAMRDGAQPAQLSRSLCYAAALRVARFGQSNEFGDWITALHTFSYCNGVHQIIKRGNAGDDVIRGIFHGTISVYLDRFLNIPPAKLPGERSSLDGEPADPKELLKRFLTRLDQRDDIEAAARIVARYLRLGHPADPLIDTLTHAAVREDADFHTLQMLEAGVRQFHEWDDAEVKEHILIAVARYLAAHAPTQRAQLQTATVALRLHRGDRIYEEDE